MILVTGASGFIGRALGRALDGGGHNWRAYSGRMNDLETLRAELEGVETVIHLAGAEARGSNRLLLHVDVEGTQRLIEEARRAGVGRLVVPSRLNADPHSMHPLLRAKGEVERLVRQGGIPYTILRTATLFGRDDRFSEIIYSLALSSWPLAWVPGGGKTPMQPLWVEDYIHCLIHSLTGPIWSTDPDAWRERIDQLSPDRANHLPCHRQAAMLFPLPLTPRGGWRGCCWAGGIGRRSAAISPTASSCPT